MPSIMRSVEFKLYLTRSQEETLSEWLRTACWVYNRALEQRKKAYTRRKQSVSNFDQTYLLTKWRAGIARVRSLPAKFGEGVLRRIDRAFKSFFARVKRRVGKAGFPRFKSSRNYRSLEQLQTYNYTRDNKLYVPGLGEIRARGRFDVKGKQKGIRVIKRASGWYAQVLIEVENPKPLPKTDRECGIDLGLQAFVTFDNGEIVENPRLLYKAQKKLKAAQRRVSKAKKGSNRRKKKVVRLAKLHEQVARKRRGFAFRTAHDIVSRYDLIAIEKLNVQGMARGLKNLRKAIHDVAWGSFIQILREKAASAGREVVEVDPRYTSQECPKCGAVKAKDLSERIHNCAECHFVTDRDVAAAMVVRQRAFGPVRGELVRPDLLVKDGKAGSKKRRSKSS